VRVTLLRDLPSEGWPSMERYADELAGALRRLGCEARSLVYPAPWRRLPGRLNAWANYLWRTVVYPRAIRVAPGEVCHILDHTYAHLIAALDPARTVVTCHDVAPLRFGSPGRGFAARLWRRSFAALQNAACVIVASAFARDELLAVAPGLAGRLRLIPYGVSPQFRQPAPQQAVDELRRRYAPGRPLLLHVGSCGSRKNVEVALRALPRLADLKPVFAQVGGRFSRAQQALLDDLGVRGDCVQRGPVDDRELACWYHAADLLVFPSFYEGFGLPVLEAMAAGLPVACANAAALPEVAQGAAVLFDPGAPADLAAAVRSILAEPGLRAALKMRGRERSAGFTWDETARLTLEAYNDVAAARSAG
jgi:glycosyltransferase involved in cell wall biosynthesis